MSEEKIKLKYTGAYTGTIATVGNKTFVPQQVYEVSLEEAEKLVLTGQFTRIGGE